MSKRIAPWKRSTVRVVDYKNSVKRGMDARVHTAWMSGGSSQIIILLDGRGMLSTRELMRLGVPARLIVVVEDNSDHTFGVSNFQAQTTILRSRGVRLLAHVQGSIQTVMSEYSDKDPVVYADLCTNDESVITPIVNMCAMSQITHVFITFSNRFKSGNPHVKRVMSYTRSLRKTGPCPNTRCLLLPAYVAGRGVHVAAVYTYKLGTDSPMAVMHLQPGETDTYRIHQLNHNGSVVGSATFPLLS